MTPSTLTYPCWMEVSTLQYHITSGLISTTTLSTKDTCNTHRFFLITNGKVMLTKNVLLTIECNELLSLVIVFYNDMVTLHHVCIKAVHWLTIRHHDIISNVYDVIDGAQTNDIQLIFQPLWAFLNLAIGNTQTSIATACLGILDSYLDWKIMIINYKGITIRTMKRCLIAVLCEPSIKITSHSIMTKSIGTVSSDIYIN